MSLSQTGDTHHLIAASVPASGQKEEAEADTVLSLQAPVDTLSLQRGVPSLRGSRAMAGPPLVPALSAHQMLAAKREQQRSMIAYSMQASFCCHHVPVVDFGVLLLPFHLLLGRFTQADRPWALGRLGQSVYTSALVQKAGPTKHTCIYLFCFIQD